MLVIINVLFLHRHNIIILEYLKLLLETPAYICYLACTTVYIHLELTLLDIVKPRNKKFMVCRLKNVQIKCIKYML